MTTCLKCNRPLSLSESVLRGMGAICAAKQVKEDADEGWGDRVDLEFDPDKKDIVCRRDADGTLHFNIHQVFKHHSPPGFEWGYAGSGPADFALNILEIFAREAGERPSVRLWDKQKVTASAWMYHQQFKSSSVFDLPREGGTIKGDDVRAWLRTQRHVYNC